MLCDACIRIYSTGSKDRHPFFEGFYAHHDTLHELRAAVRTGCYICATIWDKFTADEIKRIDEIADKLLERRRLVRPGLGPVRPALHVPWRSPFGQVHHAMGGFGRWRSDPEFDHFTYGWKLWVHDPVGTIRFHFGPDNWKTIGFALLPCKGRVSIESSRAYAVH